MSTDLSPVEQARAVQFVAEWLADNGYGSTSITGKDVIWALTVNPDSPESVESLRAERDAEHDAWQSAENALHAAVDELRAAEADVAHWREQFRLVTNARTEAIIARLRATHGDAARGRCSRED